MKVSIKNSTSINNRANKNNMPVWKIVAAVILGIAVLVLLALCFLPLPVGDLTVCIALLTGIVLALTTISAFVMIRIHDFFVPKEKRILLVETV